MANYSNILAWKIPWTEEPSTLQSMGLLKSLTQTIKHAGTYTYIILNVSLTLPCL